MYLLAAFISGQLAIILNLVMFVDGRRPTPSIWIRSDILLGIVANIMVSLLLVSFCAFAATAYGWWQNGVHITHGWLIALSVVMTIVVLRSMLPRVRVAQVFAPGISGAPLQPM